MNLFFQILFSTIWSNRIDSAVNLKILWKKCQFLSFRYLLAQTQIIFLHSSTWNRTIVKTYFYTLSIFFLLDWEAISYTQDRLTFFQQTHVTFYSNKGRTRLPVYFHACQMSNSCKFFKRSTQSNDQIQKNHHCFS